MFKEDDSILKYINEGLNRIAGGRYVFEVRINDSEQIRKFDPIQNLPVINGIITPQNSYIPPVAGLNNFSLPYSVSIFAPKKPYDYVDEVVNIVQQWAEESIGEKIEFGSYTAIVELPLPAVLSEQFTPLGFGVPISLTATFHVALNGVFGNEVKYEIDGEDLLILESHESETGVSQTTSVANEKRLTDVMEQQGLAFTLLVPYLKTNGCKLLAKEIRLPDLRTAHTLTISDGFILDENNRSPEYLVKIKNGSINNKVGSVSTIEVTFVEVRKDVYSQL